MTVELTVLYCPTCGHDSLSEAPPCPDGHGERCPDRACLECGTGLLSDALLIVGVPGTRPRPRRAA